MDEPGPLVSLARAECKHAEALAEMSEAVWRAINLRQDRIRQLETAIRTHRDLKGDDRCYLDDATLYEVLGEEVPQCTLPPKCEFLESCGRYWEQRQSHVALPSPNEMTIAQLQARVRELEERLAECEADKLHYQVEGSRS